MKNYEELEFNEVSEVVIDDISLIGKIFKIFTSPKEGFEIIAQNIKLLPIYGVYVLISTLILALPFSSGSLKEVLLKQLEASGAEITDNLIQLSMNIGLAGAFVVILITPFLSGFVFHLICMIMGKTNIKKTFTVVIYSSFIGLLGSFLSTIASELADFTLLFSPLMFLNYESMSAIPIALLSLLDFFSIWNIFVLFIGFKIVHKLTKTQTIILIAIPYTLKVIVVIAASLVAKL